VPEELRANYAHSDADQLREEQLAALYEQLYTCQVCGARKVVPGLARSCEQRHEYDDADTF